MTTATITDESTGTTRKNAWRPAKHFHIGDAHADMLDCLSPCNAATAIATGKLELRGKHANRSEGKKGRAPAVYLWMQTFGEIPQGLHEPVQKNGNFIGLTSEVSVNFVLDHFGLTLDDVRDMVGEPGEHESKHVELFDILAARCEPIKATVLQVA
jgi:hypothetical protein